MFNLKNYLRRIVSTKAKELINRKKKKKEEKQEYDLDSSLVFCFMDS